MLTIAIVSQKGGAGKTTIALNLAVAATMEGLSTAVLDTDPQASATRWGDARAGASPTVTAAQASRLPILLAAERRKNTAVVVIDTGPASDTAALAAARLADLILIPCRPSALDIDAIGASLHLGLELAGKPTYVVINAAPPRSLLANEAAAALAKAGAAVVSVRLALRVDFVNPLPAGQSAANGLRTARPRARSPRCGHGCVTGMTGNSSKGEHEWQLDSGRRCGRR
jgi:chromosome partitioning protein